MGDIIDISQPHEPIALAREMVVRAPGCKAAMAILVGRDGNLWWDMSGTDRAYVLWALQKMIHELMEDES